MKKHLSTLEKFHVIKSHLEDDVSMIEIGVQISVESIERPNSQLPDLSCKEVPDLLYKVTGKK